MISRQITPHRTGRRFITAFAVAGLLAGTILASGSVLATPFPVGVGIQNTGLFQLDGNTLPVTCGPADDWAALWTIAPNGDSPCSSDSFSFINDRTGNQGDTTYWSQGGSKDAYDPALGPWLVKSNDVSPDKNDLVNAFAAIYTYDPSNLAIPVLFFGADRFNTNGDAQMGFQFLQSAACIAATPGSVPGEEGYCLATTPNQAANSGKFVDPTTGTPIHHQNHDLLILVNFNNGGTLGLAGVFEWTGANGAGAGSFSVVLSSGTGANNPPADCKIITGSNDFCATASTTNLPGEPVWPFARKGGGSTYVPSSFIEGGVNLSRIAAGGLCFPSFLAETRSSAGPSTGLSLQAQLKDLAFGQFQRCAPSTILTKSVDKTTVRSGDSVNYSYTEENDGKDPLTNVSVSDNKCSPVTRGADQVGDGDAILEPGEIWTFTCGPVVITGDTTNTATGTGFDAALNKTVTFCENPTTPPTGVFCDQDERDSTTVTVISPSTTLVKTAQVDIHYTYKETNTGDDALTGATVTDDQCASPVRGADEVGNDDAILDPGETWVFTCTYSTTDGADLDLTNIGTGSGTDSLGGAVGGTGDPAENDSVTVTVTHH